MHEEQFEPMNNHRGVFPSLGVCCLLVALTGCDLEDIEHDDPDFTSEHRAAGDAPPCGQVPDHNFECTVDSKDLSPWQPDPNKLDIPADVKDKFEFWDSMSSQLVPQTVTDACRVPPPGGGHSPVKGPDKGGVTYGDIVFAKEDVTVYRAYSEAPFECGGQHPAGQYGGWWGLTRPQGSKEDYRNSVAICPAWNDLSMITTCTLAKGTAVLIGPTQSVSCDGTAVLSDTCESAPDGWEDPRSATTSPQLFINTYGPSGKRTPDELGKFLKDCETKPWPG